MHPFLTSDFACYHENDVRREVASARGPAPPGVRRLAVTAVLALGLLIALAAPAFANEQHLSINGTDLFGLAVAAEGNTLVVGAPGDSNGQGAVYVFERAGDAWAQTGKLTASDGASGDVLGISVGISGDSVVAGTPGHTLDKHGDAGAAYVFARTGAPTRTETTELTSGTNEGGARFGSAVAVDGDAVVVGAPRADTNM